MYKFISSFLFFFFQIVLFVVIWFALLLGLFIIVDRFISKRCKIKNFSTVGALVITSTYFFHVLQLLHLTHADHKAENKCTWYRYLTSTCDASFTYIWLWRLDPISVTANFLGELLVKFSSMFGRSLGALISGLFRELPWLLHIPAAVMCGLVFVFSVFALFGYELHIFGIFHISRPRKSAEFNRYWEKKAILPTPVNRSISIVKELYQKNINK